MSYQWPLNTSQFTVWDRIKIAAYILTDDQWTQNKYVKEIEKRMAEYVRCKYAVYVSSGSTANTLLAMYLKDKSEPNKKYIVFPSTTWITSISPFLREGFEPIFVDVSLKDFALDMKKLEIVLRERASQIACVFPTSLLGFVPDIRGLKVLANKYNVRVMLDNCENTLGRFQGNNVSSFFTSTTSSYFGHQIQSVEGGFVFTNSEEEYYYFLMARNHGMTRLLPNEIKEQFQNKNVDPRFDFNVLGNNFRNSDLHAYIGIQDIKRIESYQSRRIELYELFQSNVPEHEMILPNVTWERNHAPFCLPIILKKSSRDKIGELKRVCEELSIETRPVISGNLLRHTCLKEYDSHSRFDVSEHLNNYGFYVGLHQKVSPRKVLELARKIDEVI
jgi:CDP-4-dehydro-6-deoxyglucose reductase, E1